MSRISQNNDVLDALRDKIQEIVEDELFSEVEIIVHAFDTETGEISILGRGCIVCARVNIDKTIRQCNIKHIDKQ